MFPPLLVHENISNNAMQIRFFINKTILTIFIPPEVEPAEAPENNNKKKTNEAKGPQVAKFALAKPVVVITLTT